MRFVAVMFLVVKVKILKFEARDPFCTEIETCWCYLRRVYWWILWAKKILRNKINLRSMRKIYSKIRICYYAKKYDYVTYTLFLASIDFRGFSFLLFFSTFPSLCLILVIILNTTMRKIPHVCDYYLETSSMKGCFIFYY